MKSTRWTVLILLVVVFACVYGFASWASEQLRVELQHVYTLNSHKRLTSVAFSPDGQLLAASSFDNSTITLWDVSTGREVRTVACYDNKKIGMFSVTFSPDGRLLTGGAAANTFKVWEVATGQEVSSFYHTLISPHNMGTTVFAVSFSPDGQLLASGSCARWEQGCSQGGIKLWDVASGRLVRTVAGHTDSVYSVAFSPDGKTIASGSLDNTVKLWKVATGGEVYNLIGHTDEVLEVVFSPDGQFLASCSGDSTIKLKFLSI